MMNLLPIYNTKLFTEIWDNAEDFLKDYKDVELTVYGKKEELTELEIERLFKNTITKLYKKYKTNINL